MLKKGALFTYSQTLELGMMYVLTIVQRGNTAQQLEILFEAAFLFSCSVISKETNL